MNNGGSDRYKIGKESMSDNDMLGKRKKVREMWEQESERNVRTEERYHEMNDVDSQTHKYSLFTSQVSNSLGFRVG